MLENALRLRRAGKLQEAADVYGEILRVNPRHFEALHALGVVRYQSGQLNEAERLFGLAFAVEPRPDAAYNRACLLVRLERLDEAVACFGEAIALKPAYVEALTNRGNSFSRLNRYEDARSDFQAVTEIAPGFAEGWNNLGAAQHQLKRYGDAVASYDRAVALKPNYADAWKGRGFANTALERHAQAVADFDKALALNPGLADVWSTRGDALATTNPSDAVNSFNRALALKPNEAATHFRRGNAFLSLRLFAEAAADFRRVMELESDYAYVAGNLAFCRLSCCDWAGYEQQRLDLRNDLHAGKRVVTPFVTIALTLSPAEVQQAAQQWAAQVCPLSPDPLWRGERYRHDRIRVAYVSANFNDHAVARLMAGVFEHHDRRKFETIAISFGETDGALAQRVSRAFDHYIDVRKESDLAAAQRIRDLEADIAVDLMGYTEFCRPKILAFRPAPVQVNYLGFPGTMGTRHLDYMIADRMVIRPGEERYFDEKLAFLPDCYLPNDAARAAAQPGPNRREAGLPEEGIVFCCFNQAYKFDAVAFEIWMRLLKAVPGGVLWLPQCAPLAMRNLQREAEKRGVQPERLIFAPFTSSVEDHLARVALADLFLDTLSYNAHTSACDALWVGVPVVTVPGNSFATRVAASILSAIGLPELSVDSLEAYEAKALALACNHDSLAELKSKLLRNRDLYPLFDTASFTRHLEAAYTSMWERHQRGEAPETFSVGRVKQAERS